MIQRIILLPVSLAFLLLCGACETTQDVHSPSDPTLRAAHNDTRQIHGEVGAGYESGQELIPRRW